MKKFLIIRFSSIGDIVLTTPVVRCLRKKFPEAEIHYLIKNAYKDVMADNPYINKLHILKDDLGIVIDELKKENFDYIIDLHHNLRTLRVKKALKGVKSFSFNKLNVEKWIFTSLKINTMPDKHIVDRFMDTVRSLGVVNDGMGLDYYISPADIVTHDDLPMSHLGGYIAIVIGAAHNTKKLPIAKLKEICEKTDHPIILLGGKEDFEAGFQIAAADTMKIYNACGKFNLNESAGLIRGAKLVITHDTGLMHIASAFKKNILVLWGNTVPSFGMYPYKTFYENFIVKKLWCQPCSKIGFDKCPLGHFKCMNNQKIDEVVLRIKSIVNQ